MAGLDKIEGQQYAQSPQQSCKWWLGILWMEIAEVAALEGETRV